MGMRWRSVFLKADDDQIRTISVAAQQFLQCLRNPIDVSVVSLRSPSVPRPWVVLQMFQFLNRPPECIAPPECIGKAFSQLAYQSGRGFDARKELSKEPHIALAIVASQFNGEATFFICSDSLCCSGYLRFSSGALESGSIYGWEGSSDLWTFSNNAFQSEEIELTGEGGYNYYKPAADALIQTIGPGADELFLSPSGGGAEGEWLRYQIMEKKLLVSPVIAKPDSG